MKPEKLYIKNGDRNEYFAASNSGRGFISYYDKVFDPEKFKRIFILKGGPGCGKSSLLKKAAAFAEGGGSKCEGILCSSDPDSYDGIIINKGGELVAIIDGTSPHSVDASYYGACEKIIDLGAFLDTKKLTSCRDKIIETSKKKSMHYKSAYSALGAALSLEKDRQKLLRYAIDNEKLDSAVTRLFLSQKIKPDSRYSKEIKLKSAISMKGEYETDIYEKSGMTPFAIWGAHGASFAFIERIIEMAKSKDLTLTLSPTPLAPDIYDAVSIKEMNTYFFDAGTDDNCTNKKAIHSERFFSMHRLKEIKPTLRAIKRHVNSLMDFALSELGKAKDTHFYLENIYIDAMDFERKEELEDKLFYEILI